MNHPFLLFVIGCWIGCIGGIFIAGLLSVSFVRKSEGDGAMLQSGHAGAHEVHQFGRL